MPLRFLLVTPLLLCAQQLGMGDGLEDRIVRELLRENDIALRPAPGVRAQPAAPPA